MESISKMRTLKRLVFMTLSLIATAEVAASPLAPKVDLQCVLVEKAKIAQIPLAREGRFGRANRGHQITSGARSVLAIRLFDDPNRGPDSQTFKKATLEIQFPAVIPVGEKVTLKILRSHYSEGASAWVEQGGYAWAIDPFSHVQFRHDMNGLQATLKGHFLTINPSNSSRRHSEATHLNIECPVLKQPVTELSSWVGWVGTNTASFYLMKDIVPLK